MSLCLSLRLPFFHIRKTSDGHTESGDPLRELQLRKASLRSPTTKETNRRRRSCPICCRGVSQQRAPLLLSAYFHAQDMSRPAYNCCDCMPGSRVGSDRFITASKGSLSTRKETEKKQVDRHAGGRERRSHHLMLFEEASASFTAAMAVVQKEVPSKPHNPLGVGGELLFLGGGAPTEAPASVDPP